MLYPPFQIIKHLYFLNQFPILIKLLGQSQILLYIVTVFAMLKYIKLVFSFTFSD